MLYATYYFTVYAKEKSLVHKTKYRNVSTFRIYKTSKWFIVTPYLYGNWLNDTNFANLFDAKNFVYSNDS